MLVLDRKPKVKHNIGQLKIVGELNGVWKDTFRLKEELENVELIQMLLHQLLILMMLKLKLVELLNSIDRKFIYYI